MRINKCNDYDYRVQIPHILSTCVISKNYKIRESLQSLVKIKTNISMIIQSLNIYGGVDEWSLSLLSLCNELC